ncbi:hypothetical protein J3A83DRAFT_4186238 [Scleroderma citrinum]
MEASTSGDKQGLGMKHASLGTGTKPGVPMAVHSTSSSRKISQDTLVHNGHHFGRAVYAFCNVQMLIMNGLHAMSDDAPEDETLTAACIAYECKEQAVFQELLQSVHGLEDQLMSSSEEEVIGMAHLIQKGANGTRADDTKGMKGSIIDWITQKCQSLIPHIHCNIKSGWDFNHVCTGALLCPAGLDWNNLETCTKLTNDKIQVNSLLCSGLLISFYFPKAFKHIFMSPSSVDQEPKATCSGNACIHGMHLTTKASLSYIAIQVCFALTLAQVFSHTDLMMDSECFYNSILELLNDPDEKGEVNQLMAWWN